MDVLTDDQLKEILLEAEALGKRIGISIQKTNLLVAYIAISMVKDTLNKAVPEKTRIFIDDAVHHTNESVLTTETRR